MRPRSLAALGLLCATSVSAQPGPFLHADLQYATHVCTDTVYSTGALQGGVGTVEDLGITNRGCMFGNERQGVWMHFQVASAGRAGFTITPTQTADYDFGVWGPFAEPPWMVENAPVRCSYSALAGAGGLNYTAMDLSEAAAGDGWARYLDVQPGEWYLLYVDNFSMNGVGFALTWQLQGGATLACLEAPVPELAAPVAPVLPGTSVDLTDESGNHPYAWYWEFPTGVPATSMERDPQGIVFNTPGCHTVQLKVYNAAGSATNAWPCAVQVELGTGVANMEPAAFGLRQLADQLHVVPTDRSSTVEVCLLDARGRVVSVHTGSGELVIPVGHISPGPYTVQVLNNGMRGTRSVMLGH
ncbi:MAG: PKD domain-containing protein [Flavobacteriales bacterium]|nr:PKD domain-containing protein [Flavobacteriales bacterium]